MYFFDPPYDPLTESANFVNYVAGGFSRDDQMRLFAAIEELTEKGVKVMMTNSNSPFITHLYKNYNLTEIAARRSINRDPTKRKASLCEVIVTNYDYNLQEDTQE